MAQSARITLLFLSTLCSLFTSMAQEMESAEDLPLTHRYVFEITMEKGHISGIMITKESDDSIIGTMVNEFGVSALSFVYDKKRNKIKLQDVMNVLNKWYIKRILKQDLTFCLHILNDTPYHKKLKYLLNETTDQIAITNPKRKLTYSFRPLDPILENETTE